ncbi:MAG: transporter [Acidobacteria bacterium]|nr:transporter [Acidobacteriota bacterium]
MSFADLLQPMFLLPFVNGLLLAILLPLVGAHVRLREEWLASLGLAQAAAAGVMVGAFWNAPIAVVALVAAVAAALFKSFFGPRGNESYALMLLLGWTVALLLAANSAHGDDLGHALTEGQLYFTGTRHLQALVAVGLVQFGLLPWLAPRLLLARFFPDHFAANGRPNPHHEIVFDVLVAVTLALAATAFGVMAAFAVVFLPPWIAFRFARGWFRTIALGIGISLAGYLAAFALAFRFDQPIGPVIVGVLLALALSRAFARY